jgi:hypothetical protein
MEFKSFDKIARLKRGMVITEKIDGTNAQIVIPEIPGEFGDKPFLVGSRNRWITPEDDNFGFARWAYENQEELLKLGPGTHYGEWWGAGIQRRYGLTEKRFSLFNAGRWYDTHGSAGFVAEKLSPAPSCCYVVPILYSGPFSTESVDGIVEQLKSHGSLAAPGFMDPEGVVIYLPAARTLFKVTCKDDEKRKGEA